MKDLANQAYYLKPEIIKFLLAENLALKILLHDKGIITAEEFANYQQKSMSILEDKVNQEIDDWKKKHPEQAKIMEDMEKLSSHLEGPAAS
jgi:hypothetical protein